MPPEKDRAAPVTDTSVEWALCTTARAGNSRGGCIIGFEYSIGALRQNARFAPSEWTIVGFPAKAGSVKMKENHLDAALAGW